MHMLTHLSFSENQPVDSMKQLEAQAVPAGAVAAAAPAVISKPPQKAVSFVRSDEVVQPNNLVTASNPEEIQLDDEDEEEDEDGDDQSAKSTSCLSNRPRSFVRYEW